MEDWKEINVTFREFIARGLNEPGTQIEVGTQIYLIGDINTLGGGCDDCPVVYRNDIVKRYRVIDQEW